jgi:hypothetical protein
MTLQMIKQNLNKRVEEYYDWILTLANSLQHMVDDQLLNAFFKAGLLPYLWIATASIEQGTLIQHLESPMICEEISIDADNNWMI